MFLSAGDEVACGEVHQYASHFAFAFAGNAEFFGDLGFGKRIIRIGSEEFENLFAHDAVVMKMNAQALEGRRTCEKR